MKLSELIDAEESEWFDRKAQYPESRVTLLHDILCLANAYAESDRFLLFGVANDRRLLGVSGDPKRLTNADLHNWLRQVRLNRIPTVELRTRRRRGKEFDVLHIVNRPDKPFFVTEDKREGNLVLRAGAIYTRYGDTNVPLNGSAPDDLVELMWRERFGFGLPVLERFHRLLDQPGEWVELPGRTYRYHSVFPEFTIQRGETLVEDFKEPWSRKFLDPHAYSYYLDVRHGTTILARLAFVSCDGTRYQIPLPELRDGVFVLEANSPAMKLAKQLDQYSNLESFEETLHRVGVQVV